MRIRWRGYEIDTEDLPSRVYFSDEKPPCYCNQPTCVCSDELRNFSCKLRTHVAPDWQGDELPWTQRWAGPALCILMAIWLVWAAMRVAEC
jgi:hypothetical protein